MDIILLEYEKTQCSKIEKEVTITSMVIVVASSTETPCLSEKQAFDCNQKIACGALSILGHKSQVDWTECAYPKLAENFKTTDG